MRLLFNIMGAMIFLGGLTFFLQGINVLPGSFMTGDPQWAINGAIMMAVHWECSILPIVTDKHE